MRQISKYIPEVKDRYYIDKNGVLYTDDGTRTLGNGLQHKGYVKNGLCFKNGKQKHFFRHRLVMICYAPVENYENLQVNHINGDKQDNRLVNLEWCTNKENRIHAVQTGLAAGLKGETNPAHKLTEQDVLNIIQGLLNHILYSKLAEQYGCSKSTIGAIKAKRNWKYLIENINFD